MPTPIIIYIKTQSYLFIKQIYTKRAPLPRDALL